MEVHTIPMFYPVASSCYGHTSLILYRVRAYAPECGALHTGFLKDFTNAELLSASLLSMLCFQSSTALMYKAFHLMEGSIWLFNFM